MEKKLLSILIVIFFSISFNRLEAQCGPGTPSFIVDLTGNPSGTWTSPNVNRNDNCCGTTSPDRCIKFIITLDPAAAGISFNIASGALPTGALFYQINCGPPTPVGQPICLDGPGPHILTFCKPGNNQNEYAITSIPAAVGGTNVVINDGCIGSISASGFTASTVTWTSIFPGAQGAYDNYLSCTSGCTSPTVTAIGTPPAFIDYMVCGMPLSNCNFQTLCDTVRVTFNPTLGVTINPQNPTICFGQTSTTLTAIGSGGTPPYSYLWNNVNPSQTVTVGVGTYSVVLSDASGCPPTTASVTVTAFSVPIAANAGPDQTLCSQNNPIVTLNGTVAGASGGIWSGGSGTFSPTTTTLSNLFYTPSPAEIASGSVSLYLTTTGNGTCPPDMDTVVINFVGFNSTINLVPANVTCFGGTNGSISASISGTFSPYTYLWTTNPTQTSSTATSLSIGTYSVTVTNAYGCTGTASATITQPLPLNSTTSVTDVLCFGGNNGAVSTSTSGGTLPYSYLWSPGGATTSTNSSLVAGVYSVLITDANGCQITVVDTVIQPTIMTLAMNPVNVTCFGGNNGSISTVVTGGTAPYSYSWSSLGSTASTVSGLIVGTYTVTVTDANGCTLSSSATITEPPLLTVGVTAQNETCDYLNNGSISSLVAGGTPSYTYTWMPGSLTTANISNLSSGSYTLTVSDQNGCSAMTFATITEPLPLTISFFNQINVSCFGDNSGSVVGNVQGGTAGYTYSWSPGGATTSSISNLAAGGYTLTATDNNGCQIQNAILITQPLAALSGVVSESAVLCSGGNSGSLSTTASGGTAPYTFLWMPGGSTTQNVVNVAAGTYTVTITDALGCTFTSSIAVTEPTPMVLTTNTTNANCGQADGQAAVIVSGGIAPYTYLWSPTGGTTATADSLLSGAYTVLVTDANGCTATQWGNVNDNTGPAASIFNVINVSCNGGSDGSASVLVSGGTGPFTYSWAPYGGSGTTANGLIAGSYTVTVTDAVGCQSLATTSPSVLEPPPLVLNVITSPVSCFGGSSGGATVTATGGTPGYSFQWFPSGSIGSSITNLAAGTYTVQVTDTNSCTQSTPFIISEPFVLTASVVSTIPVSCFGGSNGIATVAASGGTPNYLYSWSPSGGNGPTAVGLSAGTYTVTITDANACTTIINVLISQPLQALSVSVVGTPATCFGTPTGSATTSVSGGTPNYSYSWSPFGGTGATATGLSQGTYIVLVTDNNGCQTNASVLISQPTQLNVSLNPTHPSCGLANGSISSMVYGGTGPFTYSWSPGGASTPNISGLLPGLYSLLVTDNLGCTVSISSNLSNIAGPTTPVLVATDVSCFAGSNGSAIATVSGGTLPYFYSWSPFGGSTNTASSLVAGTYTVTIVDGLGCTATASTIVNQPSQVSTAIISVSNSLCNGSSNGSISVLGTGGTPGYNYLWQPGALTGATINNLSAGSYTVTTSDVNSCSNSIVVTIAQPTVLSGAIGTIVNPVCYNGSNGSIAVNVSGGTVPYSYMWSNGQIGSTANNLASGSYSVVITDANGCTDSLFANVTQPTQVITTAGTNDTICLGQTATLSAVANGGAGNYYYTWQPSGTINAGTYNVSPITNTTYTVIAYDMNGCAGAADTVSAIVYSLSGANLTVGGFTPICPGQSSTIYAQVNGYTGPVNYSWNNGLGNGPGAYLVYPTQPTTYIVTVTNSCGLSATDSVLILFNPPPTISLTSDTTALCAPGTVQFFDNSVTGNVNDPIYSWFWNFGDGTTSTLEDPSHVYNQSGTFVVTLNVTTMGGCTNNNASTPLIINAYSYPTAAFSINSSVLDLPYDILVCNNLSVGATSYFWNFGDGVTSTLTDPTHPYTTVGVYQIQLIATNNFGCADTAYASVITNSDIVFPNVFTPIEGGSNGGFYDITNLDNDIFFPYTSGVIEYKLQIFNRWGELIFETFDINEGWDGYYRGVICQQDVYIWKAYAKLNNGKKFNKTGDVTLLR